MLGLHFQVVSRQCRWYRSHEGEKNWIYVSQQRILPMTFCDLSVILFRYRQDTTWPMIITYVTGTLLWYFLNQQFITRDSMVGRGSYSLLLKLWERTREIGEKKVGDAELCKIVKVQLKLCNAFLKAERAWVMVEKCENVLEGVLFGVPWLPVSFAVIENVGSWSLATWAWSRFIREEPFSVFANRCMVGNESCNLCT